MKLYKCQYCQRIINGKGNLRNHEKACAKHPGKDVLYKWVESGLTQTEMVERCEVGRGTMAGWLAEIGIMPNKRENGLALNPDEDSVLMPEMVKMPEAYGGCDYCTKDVVAICRERTKHGLWVLCENPSRSHVKWAILNGRVTKDGWMINREKGRGGRVKGTDHTISHRRALCVTMNRSD